jgi:hypothetical protein
MVGFCLLFRLNLIQQGKPTKKTEPMPLTVPVAELSQSRWYGGHGGHILQEWITPHQITQQRRSFNGEHF